MKKIGIILLVLVVGTLSLGLLKDVLIKASVENGMEIVTGLKLDIGSFKVGIVKTLVQIKNLKLYNSKGYQDKIMLDMPEVFVDYHLGDIIGGKIHLNEVRINMQEFVVIKDKDGKLNLDALKVVQAQKEGKKLSTKEKKKIPEMQIDRLELKVGKVVYKDYSKGTKPAIQEFNVNLNEKYTNITNPYSLVSLIVVKALMNTTIARLTNFDLGGLQGTLGDTLGSAQKLATDTAVKAQEAVKGTTEAIKKTTEGITSMLKSPFGSKEQ